MCLVQPLSMCCFPFPPFPPNLSHLSFLVALRFALSPLLCLIHLPCLTEVRVKGQLPGHTSEPVVEGAVMYLSLSLCFISPDNSFLQESCTLNPPFTATLHIYFYIHFCVIEGFNVCGCFLLLLTFVYLPSYVSSSPSVFHD